MTTLEKVLQALNAASESDKLAMWNNYASEQAPDDYIYNVDDLDFDELFTSAQAAVDAVLHGDFSSMDEYCSFDGYENLRSFDDLEDAYSPYDADVLADYLAETGEYDTYLDIDDDEDDEEEGE